MTNLDVATGSLIIVTGALLSMREILLSPANQTFPCAPLSVRSAMFMAGACMVYVGMLFFSHQHAGDFAGGAAKPICFGAMIFTAYNAIMLFHLIHCRRPPEVWRRARRVTERRRMPAARHRVDAELA